ncbi:hypothetical protein KTAU_00990 [Thermogemmatispora aurantia]|uniref:Uncharacterized protein n=1 Tax=Thermogemmatispora aurantia TaxID=2045279 RepID=A0A5J4K3T8_9CHLR|nr:hypothetical protein KTAU_00990 [Thermogemmatispora aurantia]
MKVCRHVIHLSRAATQALPCGNKLLLLGLTRLAGELELLDRDCLSLRKQQEIVATPGFGVRA